jgi:hypothetical protein
MHQLARIRLMMARHPWIYWSAIVVLAAVVGLGAAKAIAGVDAARRSWGEQQSVWVATAAIEPGQPIVAQRRDVPRAMVPVAAVAELATPTTARQRIGSGEIITSIDVTAGGTAGLVPDGWVAFAVAAAVDHFATGDHLNVYSGDVLVSAGLVVDVADSELMVAVPGNAAPTMAIALLADAVALGLTSAP